MRNYTRKGTPCAHSRHAHPHVGARYPGRVLLSLVLAGYSALNVYAREPAPQVLTDAGRTALAHPEPSTPAAGSGKADAGDYAFTPDSIMRLTMDNHMKIKAAKHQLESAEYNYKLFESRYTQFTPFDLNTEAERRRDAAYESETSVGVEKEYFSGGSIGADVGLQNIWGEEEPDRQAKFARARVRFPLFSSNRKLTRLIERTFEENELYSAQLDYVDTIRDTIRNALEAYYDYLPRSQILEMLRAQREELIQLKNSPPLHGRPADQQQLEGEINSLVSTIQGWEIEVESLLIDMEQWIGVEDFDRYSIESIQLDFERDGYFGEFYVSAPSSNIFAQTIENDTELMVLKLVKINAMEKKRLAQKGKWDIFLTLGGKYGVDGETGGEDAESFYEVYSDLVVRRFDRSVLFNTIRKAEADVQYIDTTVQDRLNAISAEISQKKVTLLTTKERILSSRASIDSWTRIHTLKREDFIRRADTADNYVQAFRSLINAKEEELRFENRYLDTIRDFDYICGTYFSLLKSGDDVLFRITG